MNKSKSKNYLLKKLDVLENSMITAHNKDYERVMADIGYQLTEEEKLKKKKRLQKINSYKEKRKLRQMSELRESYLQERISKVLEKQKKNNSICIKRTLPPIKYIADDVIKRKNEEEKEIIEITEDNINQRLYTFTKNRGEKIEEIFKKYKELNKKKEETTENYNLYYKQYMQKKEKDYQKKKINQINNYQFYKSIADIPIKEKKEKEIEHDNNIRERLKEIKEEHERRVKELTKKINKHSNSDDYSKSERIQIFNDLLQKKQTFSEYQQKNISKIKDEMKEKNEFFIQKEFDGFNWIKEVNALEEKYKRNVFKNTIQNQNELEKKLKEMEECIKQLRASSIVNKTKKERIELYLKKRQEEEERKEKELIEMLKAKGKL